MKRIYVTKHTSIALELGDKTFTTALEFRTFSLFVSLKSMFPFVWVGKISDNDIYERV